MTAPPGPVRRAATWWFGPARTVEDRMFSWLAVLRVVLLAHLVALNAYRADAFVRPGTAVALVGVLAAWTLVTAWAYHRPARRGARLLVADLAVTVGALLATPLVKGAGFAATVPAYWVMAPVLAWAVHWRWVGGVVAAACVAGVDLSVRQDLTQANYGNAFLLLLGGAVVGLTVESLQLMAADRDEAQRQAAAAAERARLARAVHDGVLQVLAMVQRRGEELGGDVAELGRLAGAQEVALRTLIREQDQVGTAAAGRPDLATQLVHLGARPGVEVVTAGSAELPEATAAELVRVVGACLDNVDRHAGPQARAWVLVEAWPHRVEVSVRDEGPGIPEGRLRAAVAEGRLGISESILGRVRDLGGTARLTTGPQGTEWQITVPR